MGNKSSKPKQSQPAAAPAGHPSGATSRRSRAQTVTGTTASAGQQGGAAGSRGGPGGHRHQAPAVMTASRPSPAGAGASQSPSAARQKPQKKKVAPDTGPGAESFPPTHRPSNTTYPLTQVKWRFDSLAALVSQGRIARFEVGKADESAESPEECSLCMLYYSTGLNACAKCGQGMCSDCFAVMIDPKANKCPFCDTAPFDAKYTGRRSEDELAAIKAEEEKMKAMERAQLDAAIAAEKERLERKARGDWVSPPQPPNDPADSPPPMTEAASSPPATTGQGGRDDVATTVPMSDAELADLPSDVRHSILSEEFAQRLITYYRFYSPRKVASCANVAANYTTPAQRNAAIATVVAKYGPEPSAGEANADVQLRLRVYYQLRDRNVPDHEVAMLVDRFGSEPWRAMAAVVLVTGPEFDPTVVPLPQQKRRQQGDPAAAHAALLAVAREAEDTSSSFGSAQGGGASPPAAAGSAARARAQSAGGAASSLSMARSSASPQQASSPVATASRLTIEARLARGARYQRLVSLLRFRAPHMLEHVRTLIDASSDGGAGDVPSGDDASGPTPDVSEQQLRSLAARLGPEPAGDELQQDVVRRVRHFYAAKGNDNVNDAAGIAGRYRGREHTLMAALVLKHGPEPPGAPLPPASQQQQQTSAVADATRALLEEAEAEDPELAMALRMSMEDETARRSGRGAGGESPSAAPPPVRSAAAAESDDDDSV